MATIHAYVKQSLECADDNEADSVQYGPSTSNKIERWWRELHERLEKFFKRQLLMLIEQGHYNPDIQIDRHILAFIYIPILQKEMEIFRGTIWNNHRVRCQKDAQMPKGIPTHLFSFPECYDAEDCGTAVSNELLDEVSETSGVMAYGEDYLPRNVREECERVIPHIDDVKPADAADAFLFLKLHYVPNQSLSD